MTLTQSERRVLDMQSSTLHRAAAHGDEAVLSAMLKKPDIDIGRTDLKMRTALHGESSRCLVGFLLLVAPRTHTSQNAPTPLRGTHPPHAQLDPVSHARARRAAALV